MTGGAHSAWLVLAAIAAPSGCSRRPVLSSCDDDLRGVYVAEGERWMILDHGATLEAYPLFPDGDVAPGDLVVAPRVIDLARPPGAATAASPHAPSEAAPRAPGEAAPVASSAAATVAPSAAAPPGGTLRRRYMRRAERCDAQVPVHVTRCAGDTIELVLADPAPPLAFSPCMWPGPSPSRVVRWRRDWRSLRE